MISGSIEVILSKLGQVLQSYPVPCKVAIKVNLPSLPTNTSPKTDMVFLESIIAYLLKLGHSVTILEGANGYLKNNLVAIGLGHFIDNQSIDICDIDQETDIIWVTRGGRRFPLPKCLGQFDMRLAVPCATKRPGYLFSCNIKTFVGLLPRLLCQNETTSIFSRPIIHENLTETISDLYQIINERFPFSLYLNGGNVISEFSTIRSLPKYYCSEDPIELDFYLATVLHADVPGYLLRLKLQMEENNE